MGTLNLSQVIEKSIQVDEISFPLIAELQSKFNMTHLKRSNRVNIRLRDDDISTLEAQALDAGMSFQSFLSEVIHQHAKRKINNS